MLLEGQLGPIFRGQSVVPCKLDQKFQAFVLDHRSDDGFCRAAFPFMLDGIEAHVVTVIEVLISSAGVSVAKAAFAGRAPE